MSIAVRLKQARKSRGYSQNALAEAIGVSRGVISNIEYEKAEAQPLVVQALCNVLQIDEDWLLHGKGQMDNNPDTQRSAQLLTEIYEAAQKLSEAEQDYVLDMIKTFQKHRQKIAGKKSE